MGDDRSESGLKEEDLAPPPQPPSHPHDSIRRVSTWTIRLPPPSPDSPVHPARCELTAWDLPILLADYIQEGQLYSIPNISDDIGGIIDRLKNSLAKALLHFYPLAGRLAMEKAPDDVTGLFVCIDCNNEGVQLVHSFADSISVADVISSPYVPTFVREFFPFTGALSLEGQHLPLLGVQVTELTDGMFLGCSLNHAVCDGTAFWNFMRSLAEISSGVDEISRPPVYSRWFVEDTPVPIKLPFANHDDMIDIFVPPKELVRKVFHFTSSSMAQLKEKVNETSEKNITNISSFQALCALVWRSITRARCQSDEEPTICLMVCSNRHRLLSPPLPQSYFGNCISGVASTTSVAEMNTSSLNAVATKIHEAVTSWTDAKIREDAKTRTSNPVVVNARKYLRNTITVVSSPRFEMYCEFGWGKALAVRSGSANLLDGKVTAFPGREGGGRVDLEICLLPEGMKRLEMDHEFTFYVSTEEIC